MADGTLLNKVHEVSDLELAYLLCLIGKEHCIISSEANSLDRLIQELQLISTRTFALQPIVIDCHPLTTLDDFASGIQLGFSPSIPRPNSPFQRHRSHNPHASLGHASYHTAHSGRLAPPSVTGGGGSSSDDPRWFTPAQSTGAVANVIIAKNLNLAPKAVQIQALELLRTKRLFTRTNILVAPRQFLFIAALASSSKGIGGTTRLNPHLNDFFYIAHWHDPEDGFVNLDILTKDRINGSFDRPLKGDFLHEYGNASITGNDGDDGNDDNDTASLESVVRTKRDSSSDPGMPPKKTNAIMDSISLPLIISDNPVFTEQDLAVLSKLSDEVLVDVDVTRYQMNVVAFLRLHRAVAGGISPTATRHFNRLIRCLAPLHGIDFVTPALITLAVRKIYLHRIQVTTPEKERSMQWGSDVKAIREILADVGPEDIIGDVLHMVTTPL